MGMIVLFIHIYYNCCVQSQQLNEKCNERFGTLRWRTCRFSSLDLNIELNSAVLLVCEAV